MMGCEMSALTTKCFGQLLVVVVSANLGLFFSLSRQAFDPSDDDSWRDGNKERTSNVSAKKSRLLLALVKVRLRIVFFPNCGSF